MMGTVTLLGFAAWFALLGFLMGISSGVMLTWYIAHEYQWLIVISASLAALFVVEIAVKLKVRGARSHKQQEPTA